MAARKGVIVDPAAPSDSDVAADLELDGATLDRLAERVAERLASHPAPGARR